MKKQVLGLSTVLFSVFISASAFAESMYGVLMVVKGSVKVQSASKQTTDAKVGSKVIEGDTIITGADARAKVVMADRNVINVNPDTQVVIAKYENDAASGKKNVEMNLLQGKVRNNVEQTYDGEKNKFLIKTPTAVAGVRGTQFLAGFNPQTQMTSIVTFKGSVTLASVGPNGTIIGKPVTVNKGQMTSSSANSAPEAPKSVPKEDIKKMDGESTASNSNKGSSDTKSADSKGSDSKRDVASDAGGAPSKAPGTGPSGGGNSMIDKADMNQGMADGIKVQGPPPPPPTQTTTTTPTAVATPPPAVQNLIRNTSGKTKVNVRPIQQN